MKKTVLFCINICIVIALVACDFNDGNFDNNWSTELPEGYDVQSELFIPELIDMTAENASYELTVDQTDYQFFDGYTTETLSYNNQGYLGKTIKIKNGNTFYPIITNNLDENTTIHWHGLEINGQNDGAADANAIIEPGESKTYELEVDQPASTIWYHPHAHGLTAQQVYNGLAGMIIIEDEFSNTLGLPSNYGINDIPIILQAKLFDTDGNLYHGEGHNVLEFEDPAGENNNTTSGFAIMTNGSLNPYLNVVNGIIRLRLLNASNHGVMDISLSEGDLSVIGTDGGLLETSQKLKTKDIVAGQRYEILIDLTNQEIGNTIDVIANGQIVLTLNINSTATTWGQIPNTLVSIDPLEEYVNQNVTHTFTLDNDLINGIPFVHHVINEEFKLNQIYYFEIINRSRENHSFHIHNARFLIMEINNRRVDFTEIGWKDTIYLKPGESKIIQIQFKHTGLFMLHCHILIHEEQGMMHKFQVIE